MTKWTVFRVICARTRSKVSILGTHKNIGYQYFLAYLARYRRLDVRYFYLYDRVKGELDIGTFERSPRVSRRWLRVIGNENDQGARRFTDMLVKYHVKHAQVAK